LTWSEKLFVIVEEAIENGRRKGGLLMPHQTRRDFIKTSARAAVSVAFAPALASRASATVLGANDAIGVGIIGIGIRGEILLRGTQTVANTRIVDVADVYDTHFDRARELVGPDLRTGRDYKRLLDNKDIQAVLIAVPDHWHKQMALDAMAAGKDVYLEKPMTHRWEDGDAIIDAARTQQRILQVGSQWASAEANAQAIDIIKTGKLGRVTLIDGRMHRNTPTGAWYYPVPPDASPETIDWERFIGPAPPHPFDANRFFQWRLFWDYSGGLPTDLFVHMITATHTLMGVKMASRVMAMGAINYYKQREVPDQMSALVEYPDFTLTLTSTATNNHPFPMLTIMGTEGTLEYHGAKLVYHSEPVLENYTYSTNAWPKATREKFAELHDVDPETMRPSVTATVKKPDPQVIEVTGRDSAELHLEKFFDSVRTRAEPFENAEMGHLCATVGHMVNLSYKSHREMRWDAEKRRVVEGGTAPSTTMTAER
jgi:predicted dehydrogenase